MQRGRRGFLLLAAAPLLALALAGPVSAGRGWARVEAFAAGQLPREAARAR